MSVELANVFSTLALVLVSLIGAMVNWNKDNTLVKIVRTLRPSWRETGKCPKCQKHHKAQHHKL